MKTTCPDMRHWCCGKDGSCVKGRSENRIRCNQSHPYTKDISCGRLPGHTGNHEGHGFSIIATESW